MEKKTLRQGQVELLTFLLESGEDGVDASDVSDSFDIGESAAHKRLAVLRKYDLAKRVRNEDGQLVHIITEKGARFLSQKNLRGGLNPQEVGKMASVKLQDDIVEELENLMAEEELDSLTEATDFALSNYFGLIEEGPETESEGDYVD